MHPVSLKDLEKAVLDSTAFSGIECATMRVRALAHRQKSEAGEAPCFLTPVLTLIEFQDTPGHAPQVLDYGSWVFEDVCIEAASAMERIRTMLSGGSWKLHSGSTRELQSELLPMYTLDRDVKLFDCKLPSEHFMMRAAVSEQLSNAPLLDSQLEAYPDWRTLAEEKFCVTASNANWLGEIHVVLPLMHARIEGVSFDKCRVNVRTWRRPDEGRNFLLKLWAQDDKGRAMHADGRVESEFVFTLPRKPSRAVVFMLDEATGELVDRWGHSWSLLPDPEAEAHADLADIIRSGESQFLEMKNYTKRGGENGPTDAASLRCEALAKQMVAFANTNDGTIIIGVDDDLNIRGVVNCKKVTESVLNAASTLCSPPITPEVSAALIDGRELVVVRVFKTGQLHQTKDGVFYVRRGASARPMTPIEVQRHGRSLY